jgi:hypothetical protein
MGTLEHKMSLDWRQRSSDGTSPPATYITAAVVCTATCF